MDKLIELLDEYRKQNIKEFFGDDGSLVVLTGKDFIELNRLIVISKEYGFIERLVREGKIDYWSEGWRNTPNYYESREFGQKIVNDIERLIIHLSIIEQPIEYLCKIIKE